MGTPNKLPDADELVRLKATGLTYAEIGEMFDTAPNSVYTKVARHRRDTIVPRSDHSDTIPWKGIKVDHEARYDGKMLHHLANRNQGNELNHMDEKLLDAWLAKLDAAGEVVTYDRATGWGRAKRRPSDGDGHVRKPSGGMSRS